jgi:hypothetical protein
MYIKIRKEKRENLQDVKLTQTNVKISLCQQLTACNRVAMVMGYISRGGSRKVAKPIAIA